MTAWAGYGGRLVDRRPEGAEAARLGCVDRGGVLLVARTLEFPKAGEACSLRVLEDVEDIAVLVKCAEALDLRVECIGWWVGG